VSVGKRLAEERKRIGLSQSAFAEHVGVSFSSQRRYEDGRSSPDTAYLDAIRRVGVDVSYVIGPNTGVRVGGSMSGEARAATGGDNIIAAYVEVIRQIGNRLGSSPDAIERLANFAASWSPVFWDGRSVPPGVVDALFDGCSLDVDSDLLTAVLRGFDGSMAKLGVSIQTPKKARAVAMLYRSFKASGKVDPAMIDEAVTLATD
jgi:transcriptional regulator with XRE-family HTH domain